MDIVHIASEFAPAAKVGGLGDVLHGLSIAQQKKGHRIRAVLPKYDCIDFPLIDNLSAVEKDYLVDGSSCTLWSASCHGVELLLIESHHFDDYFGRGEIYGEEDDGMRFLHFCKVACHYLDQSPPDVIHLHDWPTAGCVLFLETTAKVIFTIHNLAHQGHVTAEELTSLKAHFNETEMQDPSEGEKLNLMKGAIQESDILTTVSPTYREEILTSENGCGLEKILLANEKKLHGILNGIEIDYWNPQTDRHLIQTYGPKDPKPGKAENKKQLQKHFSLPGQPDRPLVVAITRLAPQKGPDLIAYGIERTLELGGQFLLIGNSCDEELQGQLEELAKHQDVAIHLQFAESLSHLAYAGGDMLLMPSIFEPCGLAQMIAMRYGNVPIVRETGGLKDTVIDGKNGFSFLPPDNKGVSSALERAFACFGTEDWYNIIQEGMQADLSWEKSADEYLSLYD